MKQRMTKDKLIEEIVWDRILGQDIDCNDFRNLLKLGFCGYYNMEMRELVEHYFQYVDLDAELEVVDDDETIFTAKAVEEPSGILFNGEESDWQYF